ncbi:ATP-binding cassette domain-containing protein [Caldicellulosiruptor changbaiensis]|uniref:ATP-binding cassette domain-containing protein n=1 Tax=Caldicellulosiruptor changbaiensis TaxID=1222016 RepID=A0A3T0D7B5_9FIRM|nr:ATP-binding cassette domain-containing protein [Caldicellulosiruptor changbaiensis]AZT90953.1 ATP-binding cassette domain-containing protein [Caldicellulosiruptor changbaiensis]
MIEVKEVEKYFGDRLLFRCKNLKFDNKGLYIIRGPNGCGKTTFLRMLFGKDSDFKGMIKNTFNKKVMLSQQPYFFKGSAAYNLSLSLKDQPLKEAIKILKAFSIDPNLNIHSLSLGQKQLVAFLRAFYIESDVLFLDEPDSYLDSSVRNFIFEKIEKDAQNRCIIMVTHNSQMVACSKLVYFEDNQIIEKR